MAYSSLVISMVTLMCLDCEGFNHGEGRNEEGKEDFMGFH